MNKKDPMPEKIDRIRDSIDEMKPGEFKHLSPFFKNIEINPTKTGRNILDILDSLKELPFKVLRDKDREIIGIIRIDEEEISNTSKILKELNEIKKILKNNEK